MVIGGMGQISNCRMNRICFNSLLVIMSEISNYLCRWKMLFFLPSENSYFWIESKDNCFLMSFQIGWLSPYSHLICWPLWNNNLFRPSNPTCPMITNRKPLKLPDTFSHLAHLPFSFTHTKRNAFTISNPIKGFINYTHKI